MEFLQILAVISASVPVLSAPQFPSLEGSSTTSSSSATFSSISPGQVTKEVVNPRLSSFNYHYHVNAQDTGDEKSHQQIFENGAVVGSYSVVQPDGILRIVTYRADKQSGFQAKVEFQKGYAKPLHQQQSRPVTSAAPPLADSVQSFTPVTVTTPKIHRVGSRIVNPGTHNVNPSSAFRVSHGVGSGYVRDRPAFTSHFTVGSNSFRDTATLRARDLAPPAFVPRVSKPFSGVSGDRRTGVFTRFSSSNAQQTPRVHSETSASQRQQQSTFRGGTSATQRQRNFILRSRTSNSQDKKSVAVHSETSASQVKKSSNIFNESPVPHAQISSTFDSITSGSQAEKSSTVRSGASVYQAKRNPTIRNGASSSQAQKSSTVSSGASGSQVYENSTVGSENPTPRTQKSSTVISGSSGSQSQKSSNIRSRAFDSEHQKSSITRGGISGSQTQKSSTTQSEISGSELQKSFITRDKISGSELQKSFITRGEISGSERQKSSIIRSEISGSRSQKSSITRGKITGSHSQKSSITRGEISGSQTQKSSIIRGEISGSERQKSSITRSDISGSQSQKNPAVRAEEKNSTVHSGASDTQAQKKPTVGSRASHSGAQQNSTLVSGISSSEVQQNSKLHSRTFVPEGHQGLKRGSKTFVSQAQVNFTLNNSTPKIQDISTMLGTAFTTDSSGSSTSLRSNTKDSVDFKSESPRTPSAEQRTTTTPKFSLQTESAVYRGSSIIDEQRRSSRPLNYNPPTSNAQLLGVSNHSAGEPQVNESLGSAFSQTSSKGHHDSSSTSDHIQGLSHSSQSQREFSLKNDTSSSSFASSVSSSSGEKSIAAHSFPTAVTDDLISGSLFITNENLDGIDAVELARQGFDGQTFVYRLVAVPIRQ